MIRRLLSPSKGFSLLEAVVALSLTGTLTITLCTALHGAVHLRTIVERVLSAHELNDLLDARAQTIVAQYDAHPFVIPPVVQPPGAIRFFDGTPNQIMTGTTRLRPASGSRAITVTAPAFRYALRVTGPGGTKDSLRACAFINVPKDFTSYRTALAIGIDGIWEAAFAETPRSEHENCFEVTLKIVRSMIFPKLPEDEKSLVRLVVPIDEQYTIYQTQSGELHYLGHAGEENIENQPIAAGIERFTAKIAAVPNSTMLALELSAYAQNRSLVTRHMSRFENRTYAEVLFNIQ